MTNDARPNPSGPTSTGPTGANPALGADTAVVPDAPGGSGATGGETSWFADPESLLHSLRDAHRGGSAQNGLPSVAGYEVLHEIARGGQGRVYLAQQQSTRRQVALKLLLERGFATAAARRRFEREIELLASIDHPGIVKVFDSGVTAEGQLYLVMELVNGVPLDRHLQAIGNGDDVAVRDRTVALLASIADAVHAAHRRGVIHRDLKPSNILIDGEGHPRIVDFGLARALDRHEGEPALSVTGQFVGSLPWASPEHAAGVPEAIDVRSDVYSLGVILYAALTGAFPYNVEGSFAATLKAITEAMPQRPSARRKGVSRDLDAVTLTCLAKDPDGRYASAADLAADLRAVLANAPIRARRDSAWEGMSRALRRYRLIATVASAAAIAVCAFAGVAWWQSVVAERERDRAELERGRAERRFDEARELARAFLYDFHEAVLPLAGSRPAREKIVATALDYLTGLEAEVGDDTQFRADLAGAYERVADIQGNPAMPNLGQTDAALASLHKAVALREANLAATPEDAAALRGLARAMNLIGMLEGQRGQTAEGLETLRRADAYLSRARAMTPSDPTLLREIAANRDRASTLADSLGQPERSLELLDEALAALEAIPDRRSQRDAIDVVLYKKAFCLRRANRLPEALTTAQATVALTREILVDEPNNALRKRGLSVNLNELATTQMAMGALDEAGATLTESIAIARGLYEAEPANPTTINDLGYAIIKLAQLERQRGRFDESLRGYGEAKELREAAAKRDPTNAVIRRGVAIAVAMAGEAAEAAAGDAATPPARRGEYLARAASAYEEAKVRLEAMRTDGVLLDGDEASITEMAESLNRVRSAAASG